MKSTERMIKFMEEFKVGDVVTVREGLEDNMWYGHTKFISEMYDFVGKKCIITREDSDGSLVVECPEYEDFWFFSEEMLEHWSEEPEMPVDQTLLEVITKAVSKLDEEGIDFTLEASKEGKSIKVTIGNEPVKEAVNKILINGDEIGFSHTF